MRFTRNGFPDLRHGAQFRRQAVFLLQGPVVVQVLRVFQEMLAEVVKCLLHRVKWIGHAGQNRKLHQRVKGLGQFRRAGIVDGKTGRGNSARAIIRLLGIKLGYRHPVFG